MDRSPLQRPDHVVSGGADPGAPARGKVGTTERLVVQVGGASPTTTMVVAVPRPRRPGSGEPAGPRRLCVLASRIPLVSEGLRTVLDGHELHQEDASRPGLARRLPEEALVVGVPLDASDPLVEELFSLPHPERVLLLLDDVSQRLLAGRLASSGIGALPLHASARAISAALRSGCPADAAAPETEHGLTPREQDVLAELAAGRSNAEVADALWVSENTVKTHVRNIYRKLGVTSRAAAVSAYVRVASAGD
jgi:DNA-binding CsgD family transcriptional regulator